MLPIDWKAWWVTEGEFNFCPHMYGGEAGHQLCACWTHFTTCLERAQGPASHLGSDSRKEWRLYSENAGYPQGMAQLAALLFDVYTCGVQFQRRVLNTVNFGRTNNTESYFHLYRLCA
jgi:hypothetical protein